MALCKLQSGLLCLNPSPSPVAAASGDGGQEDDPLLLGLQLWEAGLVAANILVVLALLASVCSLCVCVVRRRRQPPRDPEQVPLKEYEEDVDYSVDAEIPFNCVEFQELVHRGTFKTVHRAIVNFHPRGMMGLEVAVKRLIDSSSELGLEELMSEVYLLRSILEKAGTHPNIVSLVGVTAASGPPCLLLEYVPHGTLDRFLWSLKKGPVPEWYLLHVRETIQDLPYHKHVACDLMQVSLQVADGMCFLASHGFVHHDLSTRNIMVGPHLGVKIGNPGMFHEGHYYDVTGREHFLHDMAPECLWERRFSLFSDVWSFGILLYKVVTLETNPYPGVLSRDLYNHIVVDGQRPHLLSSFSNKLYFLLQRCWQLIPTDRPAFPAIFSEMKSFLPHASSHIILRASKDEFTPGHVSENGQVFLQFIPHCVFQPGPHYKRLGSCPGPSVDDTIHSREKADSVLLYSGSSQTESLYTTTQETEDDDYTAESNSQESCDKSHDQLDNKNGSN